MRIAPATMGRAAPAALAATAGRRADVEWLRVGGMLLVFTLHAAEPFNPWDAWHVQSPYQSKVFGELALFVAPWIMPLFMALAGESAWFALSRRSSATYVRERLLRIGLPLMAGLLLLVPPQVWLERRLRGEFEGSLVAFYPHFFEGIYPRGNFSWHHLWFLVFLLAFALVTLPLFQWLRSPRGRRFLARLAPPCEGPAGLLWLVLPAMGLRLAIELLLPDVTPLSHDWSNRGLLLLAYVAGFALAAEPGLRRAVDRHWRSALGVALGVSVGLVTWAWPGNVLGRLPAPRSAAGALLWAAYAGGAWCWLVALLGGARHHLERRTEGLVRASVLAYPFYVLHHPVVVAVAVAVVRWRLGLPEAFLVLWGASLATTVALCRIVESNDPLRVLFGLRRRGRAAVRDPPLTPGAGDRAARE